MAKKRCRYVVTVEGGGQFPFDMLRYDRATPYKEGDSGQMALREHRNVQVLMDAEPTTARWESFGWQVVGVESAPF